MWGVDWMETLKWKFMLQSGEGGKRFSVVEAVFGLRRMVKSDGALDSEL
jgi:hypothetical protein